jgi:hypothetical protein
MKKIILAIFGILHLSIAEDEPCLVYDFSNSDTNDLFLQDVLTGRNAVLSKNKGVTHGFQVIQLTHGEQNGELCSHRIPTLKFP